MQRRKQAIILSAAAVALLFVVLLAALAFRPALVLGIDGDALAHSVDSKLPSIGNRGHCDRGTDDNWACHVLFEQDPGSGGEYVAYEASPTASAAGERPGRPGREVATVFPPRCTAVSTYGNFRPTRSGCKPPQRPA